MYTFAPFFYGLFAWKGTLQIMVFLFINYRWNDSYQFVDRLYEKLLYAGFGESAILRDIKRIRGGDQINGKIVAALLDCEVFVPVIGTRWLKDEAGESRILNPDDRVRLEIRTAFLRGIRIIPVLVDGALLPKAEELPEDIRALADPNILHRSISNDDFGDLLRDIRRAIPFEERLRTARWEGKISYDQAVGLDRLPEDDREVILERELEAEKSEYELQVTATETKVRDAIILVTRLLKQHDEIQMRVGCVHITKKTDKVRLALRCPLVIPRRSVWELMDANGWRKSEKSEQYIKVFHDVADQPEGNLIRIGKDVADANQYAGVVIDTSSVKISSKK